MAIETYTPDFGLIEETFSQVWVLGTEWVIPLLLIFFTMIIITRNTEKWKMLGFPVSAMWAIVGVPVHIIILVFSAIIFGIEALSIQVVGNWIGAIKKRVLGEKREKLSELRGEIDRKSKKRARSSQSSKDKAIKKYYEAKLLEVTTKRRR